MIINVRVMYTFPFCEHSFALTHAHVHTAYMYMHTHTLTHTHTPDEGRSEA